MNYSRADRKFKRPFGATSPAARLGRGAPGMRPPTPPGVPSFCAFSLHTEGIDLTTVHMCRISRPCRGAPGMWPPVQRAAARRQWRTFLVFRILTAYFCLYTARMYSIVDDTSCDIPNLDVVRRVH